MQRLSHNPPLSPSSMAAGNTTSDPQSSTTTFTGEGSTSVIPVADALDNTPLPEVPPERPTVWRTDHRPHLHTTEAGPWRYEEDVPGNSHPQWKQL